MKAGIRREGGRGENLSLCVTKRGRPIKQNIPSGHIELSGQAITSQTQALLWPMLYVHDATGGERCNLSHIYRLITCQGMAAYFG